MMTVKARVMLIFMLLVVLIIIVNLVRKRKLGLKYVLIWMAGDIALILVTCFPDILKWISVFLGIHSPMNTIFFLGMVFVLAIVFSLTVALSNMAEKVRRISQIVAMLPEEIAEQIKKELE